MTRSMIQQVMTEPGEISFRNIEIPEPGPDQVLIRVKKIGICGSDIHVYHGSHPYTSYPVTQGHEIAGQIVALGNEVKNFKIGQKVTFV